MSSSTLSRSNSTGRLWASAEHEGAAFHLVLPAATQELEHAGA